VKGKYALFLSLGLTCVFLVCAVITCIGTLGGRQVLVLAPALPQKTILTGADDPGTPSTELLPGELIDINTADAAELCRLEGIGESLSAAIIDYRTEHGPFTAVEDLMLVPGIGEKKFAAIQDHLSIGATP